MNEIKLPPLPEGWETELLDWVSACQSAYHIDNTPGHRFGGLGSNLEENRSEIICFVRGLIEDSATAAVEADRQNSMVFECGKAAGRQEVKDEQKCPDFWAWIRRAYREPESSAYTVHNMEVAYQAGRASVEADRQANQITGETSDGYHTFNELYAHRVRLFCLLMHAHKNSSWWSRKHHDGSAWEGWIIAGIDTPEGSATYHLPESEIENLPEGTELPNGKEWDGHTSDDVLVRLLSLRQARGEPVAWTLTQQQVIALAEELIVGASALGGMDDDGIECDVRLMVRMPGTVADDDGKLNERPILAICLEEYPEEGVYPIDPANCETEHTTPQPQQQAGGEPVARWAVSADGQNRTALPVSFTEDGYKRLNSIRDGAMLYTTPQPQQQVGEPVAWLRSDELRKLGHPYSDAPLNSKTDSMMLHAKGTQEAAAKYGHDVPVFTTPQPQQRAGEPVLYQSRTRPIWAGSRKRLSFWKSCTKDQANDYRRVKVLHDWEYEVRELYPAPQPQQIPEGYKLVPQRLISLCEQFTKWRHCMSYNDSYFGEPEGDLKRIAAEMERAMLEAAPGPKESK